MWEKDGRNTHEPGKESVPNREPEFWGASFKPVSRRITIKMVMVKTIIVTEEEN